MLLVIPCKTGGRRSAAFRRKHSARSVEWQRMLGSQIRHQDKARFDYQPRDNINLNSNVYSHRVRIQLVRTLMILQNQN